MYGSAGCKPSNRQQSTYNAQRYRSVDPVYAWLAEHASSGHRVGLAGVFPVDPYPPPWIAFGPRVGNKVEYIGPRVRHRLERPESLEAFSRSLRDGRFDVVLVGLIPTEDERVKELAGSTRTDMWRFSGPGASPFTAGPN